MFYALPSILWVPVWKVDPRASCYKVVGSDSQRPEKSAELDPGQHPE